MLKTKLDSNHIRSLAFQTLGNIPSHDFVPTIEFVESEDLGYGSKKKFTFDNNTGSVVYGYLFVPNDFDESHQYPIVQYPHWHAEKYEQGKRELLEEENPNKLLRNLLTSNILVVSIDAYGFGERRAPEFHGRDQEWYLAKYNLLYGTTLWGMMLRDELLLLNWIKTLNYVDTSRIGVSGISMGCTKALWLSALRADYKITVGINCTTRLTELIEEKGLNHHGIYYYPFGLLAHFDVEVLYSCIAPRDLLLINAELDALTPVKGVHHIAEHLEEVYEKVRSKQAFRSTIYSNVGHEFTQEMLDETTEFIIDRL